VGDHVGVAVAVEPGHIVEHAAGEDRPPRRIVAEPVDVEPLRKNPADGYC
jgi:hypothetical protein